jgi:hypothetical protein
MGAKLIGIGGGPGVDPYVAALGPSQFLQSLTEGCDASLTFRIVRRGTYEHPDEPYPLRLLRARRDRPRRCPAEQRDELPPPHTDHGDVLPRAVSAPLAAPCSVCRPFGLPQDQKVFGQT